MNAHITSAKQSDKSTLLFFEYGFGEEELDEKDYIEAEIEEESFYNYLTKFITLPFNKNKYSDKVAIDVEPKLENANSSFLEDNHLKIAHISNYMAFSFLYGLDFDIYKNQYTGIIELENTVSNLPEQAFFPISSLSPKRITRTSPLVENFHNNVSFEEMIEHDIIVRMPPKKRYTINLQVVSIKRAQPKIVEPEGI